MEESLWKAIPIVIVSTGFPVLFVIGFTVVGYLIGRWLSKYM